MTNQPAVRPAGLGVIVVVATAALVAGLAVWLIDRSGRNGHGLPEKFVYQIDQYKQVDPALIAYEEVLCIDSGLKDASAVAVGLEDRILAAGDRSVRIFDSQGGRLAAIELSARPSCLAVAPADHPQAGRVFAGMGDHIEVFSGEGKPLATWPPLGEKAILTSIALAEADVFVADAGQARVHRLSLEGEARGAIGGQRGGKGWAPFAVPSPFFDVAIHPDGWLRVVNPGALRVEAYSYEGKLQLFWGEGGARIDGFFGCCNPANIAVLPDGRFVTAEKGLVRVKIYSADGQFESVVAGPETFGAAAGAVNESLSDHEYTAVDVAVDGKGRVVALDLTTAKIHVFQTKPGAGGSEAADGSR